MKSIGENYKLLRAVQSFDPTGNLTKMQLDPTPLARVPKQGQQLLNDFHQPITEALSSVAVPLPNKNAVAAMDSWKATRTFPVDMPDGKIIQAKYDLTYTYVGQRKRDGRDEAVISIAGELNQVSGKNLKVGATLSGTAVVELATGETISARTSNVMDVSLTINYHGESMTLNARASTETRVDYARPKQ
jgi:hypothetical protein